MANTRSVPRPPSPRKPLPRPDRAAQGGTDAYLAELARAVAQLRAVADRHNDAIRLLEVGLQRAAATLEEVTR